MCWTLSKHSQCIWYLLFIERSNRSSAHELIVSWFVNSWLFSSLSLLSCFSLNRNQRFKGKSWYFFREIEYLLIFMYNFLSISVFSLNWIEGFTENAHYRWADPKAQFEEIFPMKPNSRLIFSTYWFSELAFTAYRQKAKIFMFWYLLSSSKWFKTSFTFPCEYLYTFSLEHNSIFKINLKYLNVIGIKCLGILHTLAFASPTLYVLTSTVCHNFSYSYYF